MSSIFPDPEVFRYALWDYLFFVYFIVYILPLAAGSFSLAKKICREDFYERFAFASLLTLLCGGLIFALAALAGWISSNVVFMGNLFVGLLFIYAAKKLPAKQDVLLAETSGKRSFTILETALAGFLGLWAVSRLYPVISMPPFGTDSYMYHLYYPAEWIRTGTFSRITIIGLFPEYYPVFGELLYGFLMLPMAESAALAATLQWLCLVMGCACMVFLAEELGYGKDKGLFVSVILFATGIIMMNLLMAYTDVLNSVLCFAGFCFMLGGFRRNDLYFLLFAGILMGCSTAVKPLGLLWSPVITLVFSLVMAWIWKTPLRKVFFLYLAAVLTAMPFFVGNWINTGNPLYPQKLSLAGIDILSPGVSAKVYNPIGLKDFPSFILEGGLFGFNKASIYLYALCGLLAAGTLVLSLCSEKISKKAFPDEKCGRLLKIFIPCILLFVLIHILVYPRIAENRSLILLLMFWSVFFLPVLQIFTFRVPAAGRISFAGIVFFLFLPFTSYTTNFLTWGCNWGMALAGVLCFVFLKKDIWVKRVAFALVCVFAFFLPCQQTLRGFAKERFYKMMFSPVEYRSFEIVREAYKKGIVSNIDYVGGVFAYVYMEDMKGNKVMYVPISRKESTHVHEFDSSYEKMRNEPVSYEEWKERLKKNNINLLIVNTNTPALIFNRRQELEWAEAHPENFTLLASNENTGEKSFYVYKVHDL